MTTPLWVDRVHGSDESDGGSRDRALRTLAEAWSRVPSNQELASTGYRILLTAGTYPTDEVPVYWESRWGTYNHPVILEAADGPGTVRLPALNFYDCRYLYLLGLAVEEPGGDVLHCERCDHFLLRDAVVSGADPETYNVQETLKINQSSHVYIEESDIAGAWDNALDCVGVQTGHIVRNRIHNAGDWCLYLKGGSAYFLVEGNEFYDCGTGGFTAGQGLGLEFMVAPWIHHEASDIKFVNNIVHDVEGAAMGVHGGYNILQAFNTFYRVGVWSHGLEYPLGERSCDGDTASCSARLAQGGWGTDRADDTQFIPNRHVYVYNNVLHNPDGVQSQWQHFWIPGPVTPAAYSNLPNPSVCDEDLRIRGNVIWNGPSDLPLGIEGEDQGCQPSNGTCNAVQLRTDNAINTLRPELADPAGGNYRPSPGGNLFTLQALPIPDFPGGDRPQPPLAAEGDLDNTVTRDYGGNPRPASGPPGAYAGPPSSHARPVSPP